MARVLVVGGAGYVGGAITDLLAKTDHEVRVFDALLYEECYRKPVDFVHGDIRDTARLRDHLGWAEVVVWLAALVGDGACALNPDVSVTINQDAVAALVESFRGRIVFTSTCSVYGAQEGVLDEGSPLRPLSVYASTKLAAEELLRDRDAIIFRLGTLFGLGDAFSRIRLDLVVNTLTVRAHQEGRIRIFGGQQYRPLLHVRDVARAVVDTLCTPHRGVFNLHRENVRMIDLAHEVAHHFPGLKIEETPMKFEDARNYRVSSDAAREAWGFAPNLAVDDGVLELKELLASGRLRNTANPRYTNQGALSMFSTHLDFAQGGER